jgi:hypothetical protein
LTEFKKKIIQKFLSKIIKLAQNDSIEKTKKFNLFDLSFLFRYFVFDILFSTTLRGRVLYKSTFKNCVPFQLLILKLNVSYL